MYSLTIHNPSQSFCSLQVTIPLPVLLQFITLILYPTDDHCVPNASYSFCFLTVMIPSPVRDTLTLYPMGDHSCPKLSLIFSFIPTVSSPVSFVSLPLLPQTTTIMFFYTQSLFPQSFSLTFVPFLTVSLPKYSFKVWVVVIPYDSTAVSEGISFVVWLFLILILYRILHVHENFPCFSNPWHTHLSIGHRC